jgi:hypothetical protein
MVYTAGAPEIAGFDLLGGARWLYYSEKKYILAVMRISAETDLSGTPRREGAVSETAGQSRPAADLINYLKLAKAYNAAQKARAILNREETTESAENDGIENGYFAARVNSPALESMKAALPYLELKHRRKLGVMIKLIEIQKLLEAYGDAVVNIQERTGSDWRMAMIKLTRPHLNEEGRLMLDTVLKAMDLSELINTAGEN